MTRRQTEIKKLMQSVLEDDFGLTVIEFGVRKGSCHQYARVEIDGKTRDISFSMSPSKTVRRGSLRADLRKRFHMWGHDLGDGKNA